MRELAGKSPAMVRLQDAVRRVARSDACVLICGETGSGKGLVARHLHGRSPRGCRPFVHVDCAALSPTVIESELFGHERGAFTDAVARRVGRLERAGGGTVFLDEIGDLAAPLQSKLLRVLQDREFERVGGSQTLPLRARVIAATHRDLPAAVAAGRFRGDLYYRLDVLSLHVPPLRERREDIAGLVAEIAARSELSERAATAFEPAALRRLAEHRWPGNVRELENVVARCLTFAGGRAIDLAQVERALAPRAVRAPAPTARRAEAAAGREAIVAALLASGGSVRAAARALGVPRSTLRYRIQRLALEAAPGAEGD